MAHVNKARQFTDLGMVHCESFSTRTDQRVEYRLFHKTRLQFSFVAYTSVQYKAECK